MTDLLTCAKTPCKTCPYRQDVPSGIWHPEEYAKLPGYDGDTWNQAPNLFMCHQQDGQICAGWVGCHNGEGKLLAMRMHHRMIDPSVWNYESPIPLFASGAEAFQHGMRDISNPGPAANRKINQLVRKRERNGDEP